MPTTTHTAAGQRHREYEGMRIGTDIPPEQSIADQASFATWAEGRGFDDAWSNEISSWDPFVVLSAVAARTERIRLGTSIVPIGTRTPPVLALSATSLADLCPGRFVLGLGVSTTAIIEDWHGLTFARPRERMRETLTLLSALLAGERSDHEGKQVRSRKFKLRRPPEHSPPIALAAMNQKMLETGGELADGVFLNFIPPGRLDPVLEAIGRGVERAGRDSMPELLIALPCEVTNDRAAARDRFARTLAFYLTAPAYRSALSWYGFEEDVAVAEEAWGDGGEIDRLQEVVSDRLIDEIGAFGGASECRARIAEYGAAGVRTVTITALGETPLATLDELAPNCKSEEAGF